MKANHSLSRRTVLAGAAATIPAAAVPALASNEPDPIFAAIEQHRSLWHAHTRASLEADQADGRVDKDEDPYPYQLIAWRNYSAIGGREIERARDEFLAEGIDPDQIEREYQDARQRYEEQGRKQKAWEDRHGLTPLIERREKLYEQWENANAAFTNVMPTTMAGVLALLAYIDSFNRGELTINVENCYSEHWLWPDGEWTDDEVHNAATGRPLKMPFPYWVMRNVHRALQSLAGVA